MFTQRTYARYLVFLRDKKKRMALSTRLSLAGGTRSSNSLVRSKAQGNVPRLEIKNQTYEKLRQRHKKLKPFKCHGVWLLPPVPSSLPSTGWNTSLLQGTTSFL